MSKKAFVDLESSGGKAFEQSERADIEAEPRIPSHRDVSASFADKRTEDEGVMAADVPTLDGKGAIDPGCNGEKAPCTGTEAVASSAKVSDLAEAVRLVSSIDPLVRQAKSHVEHWLDAEEGFRGDGRYVIAEQADRLIAIASALTRHIAMLDAPRRVDYFRCVDRDSSKASELIETETAYDPERLARLHAGSIRDAIQFDTELKDTFGLASMDEELRIPLCDALSRLLVNLEDGSSTVPGMVVMSIKALLKGHPRGFGRYYSGKDPWPRSPAVVQTEIDERMPDALRWLRYELQEALEEEAASPNPASDSLDSDRATPATPDLGLTPQTEASASSDADKPFPRRLLQGGDIDESLFDDRGRRTDLDEAFFSRGRSTPGYLPIEADEALRKQIEADPRIDPEHLDTLDGIKLLLTSDAEKDRLFFGGYDRKARVILNDLLRVAIQEIEVEQATVVGIVNVLIMRMMDICGELRRPE